MLTMTVVNQAFTGSLVFTGWLLAMFGPPGLTRRQVEAVKAMKAQHRGERHLSEAERGEDPLGPAKGCLVGLALGGLIWAALGLAVFALVQLWP